jgi:hypothetical protein
MVLQTHEHVSKLLDNSTSEDSVSDSMFALVLILCSSSTKNLTAFWICIALAACIIIIISKRELGVSGRAVLCALATSLQR